MSDSLSRDNRQNELPDIVRLYQKHIHGTVEPLPSKKWLDILEEQIITFLGKLFQVRGFDKPLKCMTKSFENCLSTKSEKPIKDVNVMLVSIASLVNMLDEELLCEMLPMVANLICMAKHDLTSVKTADARKIVLKFKDMITSPGYLALEQPVARLKKLIEVVDSVRLYEEYLLRSGGQSPHGRSPREILRDIIYARDNSAV